MGGYHNKDFELKTKARLSLVCFDCIYILRQGHFALDLFSFLVTSLSGSFIRGLGSFSLVFRHSFFVVFLVYRRFRFLCLSCRLFSIEIMPKVQRAISEYPQKTRFSSCRSCLFTAVEQFDPTGGVAFEIRCCFNGVASILCEQCYTRNSVCEPVSVLLAWCSNIDSVVIQLLICLLFS